MPDTPCTQDVYGLEKLMSEELHKFLFKAIFLYPSYILKLKL
jgi:hypothetical protein